MSGHPILTGTRSTIFSPASGGGPALSVWPVGQTTGRCGPGHVPVNLSARQARERGLLTSGICGRPGTGSSSSAALQRFLESRLAGLVGPNGSILYSMIWRPWITPAERSISRLAASGHRTSGSVFIGWPTPRVTSDGGCGSGIRSNQSRLEDVVQLAGWATPAHRDYRHANILSYSSRGGGRKGEQLNNQVIHSGPILSSSGAKMASTGQLNPEFSRWLMGYPAEWDSCGAMAMQSCRSSRRNLSKLSGIGNEKETLR